MKTAKKGDIVKVHYTGRLEDGTAFDTSEEGDPEIITIGEGAVNPVFEEALTGMQQGDSKTVNLPAEKAYGNYKKKLVFKMKRKKLNLITKPEVGQTVRISLKSGQKSLMTVKDIGKSTITLDANHPLAGKDLTFEIKLIEIISDD